MNRVLRNMVSGLYYSVAFFGGAYVGHTLCRMMDYGW